MSHTTFSELFFIHSKMGRVRRHSVQTGKKGIKLELTVVGPNNEALYFLNF